MKTLIIYHQTKPGVDCPDGITAAWVASKKYPDYKLCGCVYNAEELPNIPKDCDRVVIVDFSFEAKILEQWREQVSEVIVIDHHKTAMGMLEGLSNTVLKHFDMNECGATLTWKTFFPNQEIPVFLSYVRDRDLWNHELPRTREIHETMAQMCYGLKETDNIFLLFELFNGLAKLNKNELVALGCAISGPKIKAKDLKINEIANRWKMYEVAGHQVPVVFLAKDGSEDRLVSDVCSRLYTHLHPNVDFVACFTADRCWSLRSDKNKPGNGFDVGTLAKSMGGGGHHNAAGFGPVNN